MAYRYLFVDARTGAEQAELKMADVTYELTVNQPGTWSGNVILDDDVSSTVVENATAPRKRCIYIYRDGVLLYGGMVWSRRYNRSTRRYEVAGGDWLSYLAQRALRADPTLKILRDVDVYAGVRRLWSAMNSQGRGIGLVARSAGGGTEAVSEVRVERWDPRNFFSVLGDYSGNWDAFEIAARTVVKGATGIERQFYVQAPRIDTAGNPHVFDGSLIDLDYSADGGNSFSTVIAIGAGAGSGRLITTVSDTRSASSVYPTLETITNHDNVYERDQLMDLANHDLKFFRDDHIMPTIRVTSDGPPELGDYEVGDWAVVRLDNLDILGTEYRGRIVGVRVAIEETERIEIKLSLPDGRSGFTLPPVQPPYPPSPCPPGKERKEGVLVSMPC